MDAWTDSSRLRSFAPRTAVADATRVAPRPQPETRKPQLPAPQQTYIRSADPADFERARRAARVQQHVNTVCGLDPFAAQVNGMRDVSLNGKPNWQRVGASPLEYAVNLTHPTAFGLVHTARGVAEAIHEPNAVNVTTAAVGVATLGLGGLTRLGGLPHGIHAVAEGAERAHMGLNLVEAGGSLDRIKQSLHSEHKGEKPKH